MTQIAEAVTAAIDRANEWPGFCGEDVFHPDLGIPYSRSTEQQRMKYG